MMNLDEKKQIARQWFENLRDQICDTFEAIEIEYSPDITSKFERKIWKRPNHSKNDGGGGVMSIMHGSVFEKVGVNVSTVFGEFSEHFRKEIPGAETDPRFWASGISLVAHPKSPHVPPVHMNTRYIVTQKDWFGGGADLNPIYPNDTETALFHKALEEACEKYNPDCYQKFKILCDNYFYIPHRNEHRGVGGIFFDQLNSQDWQKDFNFVQDTGKAFHEVYANIVRQSMTKPWTEEERQYQLHRRGRYVEFNLIYDRGTRFGLQTNGNAEAILMSLPPLAAW